MDDDSTEKKYAQLNLAYAQLLTDHMEIMNVALQLAASSDKLLKTAKRD